MRLSINEAGDKDKWIIETVEKASVGEYASHVLDLKNKVHLAYFDHIHGDLKYAMREPQGWVIDTVDQEGTVGQFLSITKDTKGKIYISYRDQGRDRLKLAFFDGVKWSFEVVDNEPFASFDTSIFVDTMGIVYISYFNFSKGCLKLAVKSDEQWKIEIIDAGRKELDILGGFSSIKVDSLGRIHVSYVDSTNGFLKYALKEDDSWNIEVADGCEFVGNFTSLALDKDGKPYISYTVDKAPNKPDLWLAKKTGSEWILELVDTEKIAGNYSSIVVDDHSNVYISYSAMSKLKMAKKIQGSWNFEVVDPKGTVMYTTLSIDKDGMHHITYYDVDTGVKYACKKVMVE